MSKRRRWFSKIGRNRTLGCPMSRLMTGYAACVLVLAVACSLPSKANPDFCDSQSDCVNGTSCDLATNACVPGCVVDDNCNPATPFCNVAERTCTECGPLGDNTHCSGSEPVCGADLSCRGCEADSLAECPDTGICLAGGGCATTGQVIFVDATSAEDNAECSQALPCRKLETALQALTATRNLIILAAGTYAPTGPLMITLPTTIRGPRRASAAAAPSATIDRTGQGPSIIVQADLAIEDLRIRGTENSGAVDGTALLCHATGPKLGLLRVDVVDNSLKGIDDDGCALTVTQCTFRRNFGGGILVKNAAFSITNSFFTENGVAGTSILATEFGGLRLEGAGASNVFAFNSISRNNADFNAGVTGVDCRTPNLRATSNIIHDNGVTQVPEVSPGPCTFDHSVMSLVGTGNMNVDPLFVDVGGGDLHLQPASPARGAGASDIDEATDFDGELRPRPAGAPDIGADEVD